MHPYLNAKPQNLRVDFSRIIAHLEQHEKCRVYTKAESMLHSYNLIVDQVRLEKKAVKTANQTEAKRLEDENLQQVGSNRKQERDDQRKRMSYATTSRIGSGTLCTARFQLNLKLNWCFKYVSYGKKVNQNYALHILRNHEKRAHRNDVCNWFKIIYSTAHQKKQMNHTINYKCSSWWIWAA